jgi:hypothetical protein
MQVIYFAFKFRKGSNSRRNIVQTGLSEDQSLAENSGQSSGSIREGDSGLFLDEL